MSWYTPLKKKFNWEFWPTYMFYIPLFPLYVYYSLRSGNFTYFVAANPGIKNGGDATESKFDTLKILPKKLIPNSIFIPQNTVFEKVLTDLKKNKLNFPLIIKPDIGYRGLLVNKIKSEKDLEVYLKKYSSLNLIIQEFVNYPNECGILYYRYPNEKKGTITSITLKSYLQVKGDGTSNISDLIAKNAHVKRYESIYKDRVVDVLDYTPKKEETYILNEIGNHCKGASFINGNHLISKELTETFDALSPSIKGVYFGRFDIKYQNFKDLEKGENYKIIELNGVIAEPTHIYDASKSSFLIALKSIAKHWHYIYKIANINHKNNGVSYAKLGPELKALFALRPYNKKIKALSEI